MATEYSQKRLLDRVWAQLARTQTVGLSLAALAVFEALRHWQQSDEALMLVRVAAVMAITAGVANVADALRPRPQAIGELSERGFVGAWWFPFFQREQKTPLRVSSLRWTSAVLLYALAVIGIPVAALINATDTRSHGELMLVPGQGAESFVQYGPDPGVHRAMGVKLELHQATLDGPTPVAELRATDMQTLAATDLSFRSADVQRVRGILVSIRELRPFGGLGAVQLEVEAPTGVETLTLRRGGDAPLADGSTLRWVDATSSRLGTLGPAVQIAREREGELLERRWIYLNFPTLNAQHAEDALSMKLLEVDRPIAVLLSVTTVGAPPWGALGIGLLVLVALLLLAQRFLPLSLVGRDGDYVALGALTAAPDGSAQLQPSLVTDGEAKWVQPLAEEDFE